MYMYYITCKLKLTRIHAHPYMQGYTRHFPHSYCAYVQLSCVTFFSTERSNP